jgi:hypothetical protein
MKKIIFLASFFMVLGLTANAQQADTTVTFAKTIHDFGEIAQNAGPQTHTFEFTNTGDTPVIIQNVSASCGCTTPGWTKEPIAPGEKGEVKATYSPSGLSPFDKTLSVYTTGNPSFIVLHIKGQVVAPKTEEQQ